MKVKITATELKTVIEKAMAAAPKKSSLSILSRLYFIAKNDQLTIFASDMEIFLNVKADAIIVEDGEFAVDIDDLKPFIKAKGDVTLETGYCFVKIKSGTKAITVNTWNTENRPEFPQLGSRELIAEFDSSWLYETLTKLVVYTAKDSNNKMLTVVNLNTKRQIVEAVDGHRIGFRNIPDDCIKNETETGDFLILNTSVPIFKKLLDKNGSDSIRIYEDEKYIFIEQADRFTYAQRKLEGKFFDTKSYFTEDYEYSFDVDRKQLLSNINDIRDLMTAEDKKPVIYDIENEIKSSFANVKYKIEDEIPISNNTGSIRIGFNPNFIYDVCNTVGQETLHCFGTRPIDPMTIVAEEEGYRFIVLPVNINKAA